MVQCALQVVKAVYVTSAFKPEDTDRTLKDIGNYMDEQFSKVRDIVSQAYFTPEYRAAYEKAKAERVAMLLAEQQRDVKAARNVQNFDRHQRAEEAKKAAEKTPKG